MPTPHAEPRHDTTLAIPPERGFASGGARDLGLIVLLCILCGYLRWLKLGSLAWGDPVRWLFEAQRFASGEMPYHDFSWQYPPLSVLLLGFTMRTLGATFLVAQIFADVLSLVVVLAAYFLFRPLIPQFLHLPVMFCFLAVCVTGRMWFNLFSFLTYVPSLQLGAAGFLLFLAGLLAYLRTGKLTTGAWLLVAGGAFLAAFSKPESFLATYGTLAVLAAVDRNYWFDARPAGAWIRHYAGVFFACAIPAAAAYIWTGTVAGFADMLQGIKGYGLAGTACPWWPTGLGAFGAGAALGEAAFLAAMLSLTRRRRFAERFGKSYRRALAVGAAGGCFYLAYVFQQNWSLIVSRRPLAQKLLLSAPSTVQTSAVLLPVMWTCVILWFGLLFRWTFSRRRADHADSAQLLILLTGPVIMSARGWFNTTLDVTTQVPAICYPFFLLLGPYLLWRLLLVPGPGPDLARFRAKPAAAIAIALAGYALLRIVGGYSEFLSNQRFRTLSTRAGTIRLANFQLDSDLYDFVVRNTSPSDRLLDLPYGGGFNFAARRASPSFNTQFRHVSPADSYLERDLDALRRHPPKLIIVEAGPNFGAIYGLKGCLCAFPRLVWIPPTSTGQPDKFYPAFAYIQQNYRVARIIGPKLLLVPK